MWSMCIKHPCIAPLQLLCSYCQLILQTLWIIVIGYHFFVLLLLIHHANELAGALSSIKRTLWPVLLRTYGSKLHQITCWTSACQSMRSFAENTKLGRIDQMLPEIRAGSFVLPIMVIGTRSVPVALQQTTSVMRSFVFFLASDCWRIFIWHQDDVTWNKSKEQFSFVHIVHASWIILVDNCT